jgi:hypothetical protein
MVVRRFNKCGVPNKIDGSKVKLLWGNPEENEENENDSDVES